MHRPFRWVLAAALAGCGAPAAPSAPPDPEIRCEETAPVELKALFARRFDRAVPTGCNTPHCHAGGVGGLAFSTAVDFHDSTVNQPSSRGEGPLVAPGDPAGSALFRRLLPSSRNRMPQGGPYFDEEALREIAGWICAGAPPPAP